MNKLEQLKTMTTVVADTGDIDAIAVNTPTDATTNPSLLYKAAQKSEYAHLLQDAIDYAMGRSKSMNTRAIDMMDKLAVNFGAEILDIIPGRISTEVDARLSFDSEASIARAESLIDLYNAAGIEPSRVLIKIASTWEGIQAARELEQRGIHCNLTLMFSLAQAISAAEGDVPRRLDADQAKAMNIETLPMHESAFRWMINEDAMATEKLAEGIRNFAKDALKLEEFACHKCG
jgi:transaldolase